MPHAKRAAVREVIDEPDECGASMSCSIRVDPPQLAWPADCRLWDRIWGRTSPEHPSGPPAGRPIPTLNRMVKGAPREFNVPHGRAPVVAPALRQPAGSRL